MNVGVKNQQGVIHLLPIIIIIALLLVGGFYLVKARQKASNSSSEKVSFENTSSASGSCDAGMPRFTAAVTELDKIDAFGPLGGVSGGSPGRSYIGIKKGNEVAVYNPGEAILETIVYARRGGGGTPGEYGLYFRAGCDITYLLDHIDRVTDEIKALAPQEPAQSSATQYGTQPNKTIKAGVLLGYSDGTPLAHTFDFLVEDKSKKAYHINEKRWDWSQTVYSVCPYDLYPADLKAKFYALLGTPSDSGLIKAGSCGGPSQDVDDTASGGWFQGDSTTTKGQWLAIGKELNTADLAIRDSGNIGFTLKDYAPKILPDKLTPGNQVCYSGYSNNWAYLNLLSKTQLSLATGTGKCPSSFPSSQAEVWER